MKLFPLFAGLLISLLVSCNNNSAILSEYNPAGKLQPWSEDPNWWSWDGQTPVLLLGGSSSEALFLEPDFKDEISALRKNGGNYLRCTLRVHTEEQPSPFQLVADSSQFNLSAYNEAYWHRLEEMITYAESIGVAVEIVVWDFAKTTRDAWPSNPWSSHPAFAAAGGEEENFLPGEHPFFQTVPNAMAYQPALAPVLRLQEAFVDQLLKTTLRFDNVMYNYSVPTNLHIPWMVYWGQYTEDKAAGRTINVNVGISEPGKMNVAAFNQRVLSGEPVVAHPAPPNGNGLSGLARASIRGVRVVEQYFRFDELKPADNIFGETNTIASAATDGRGNYLIYLPKAASVDIYPDVEMHDAVRVIVVGYLGTQRSEIMYPPYGDSFRLFTDEEKGGWMILKGE